MYKEQEIEYNKIQEKMPRQLRKIAVIWRLQTKRYDLSCPNFYITKCWPCLRRRFKLNRFLYHDLGNTWNGPFRHFYESGLKRRYMCCGP